jgi:hypothetical protein
MHENDYFLKKLFQVISIYKSFVFQHNLKEAFNHLNNILILPLVCLSNHTLSNTILNYYLSYKLKLIGNDKF